MPVDKYVCFLVVKKSPINILTTNPMKLFTRQGALNFVVTYQKS